MNTTDLFDKIRQLRALAQSANAFEAANAAAAADKLIAKYRISEEELRAPGVGEGQETAVEDQNILYESARIIRWKSALAMHLTKHYGVALWNSWFYPEGQPGKHKTSRYKMVGRKSDMEITSFLFAFLVLEIERLTKLNCKGQGHIASYSYADGVVAGIKYQLDKSKEEIKQEAESTGHSQAIISLDARYMEAYNTLHKLHPNLKKHAGGSNHQTDSNYYQSGVSTGKNIHLGKSMAGKGLKLLGK